MPNFNLLAQDWWTARGWARSTEEPCTVCGTHFGVAHPPSVVDGEEVDIGGVGLPFCEFHSHMSEPGLNALLMAKLSHRRVDRERWEGLRLNSYDRDALIPYLSNEVLCDVTEYALKNCRRISRPAAVYDDAVPLYAAELVKRLRK